MSAQSITPGEGPAARARARAVGSHTARTAQDGDVLPGVAQPQSSRHPSSRAGPKEPHNPAHAQQGPPHPRDQRRRGGSAWPPRPSTSWPQPAVQAPFREPRGTQARLQLPVLTPGLWWEELHSCHSSCLPALQNLGQNPPPPRGCPFPSFLYLAAVPFSLTCLLHPPNTGSTPSSQPRAKTPEDQHGICFTILLSFYPEVRVYKRAWLEAKGFFN